jgi:Cornifin (SPRR) family/PEGA domain
MGGRCVGSIVVGWLAMGSPAIAVVRADTLVPASDSVKADVPDPAKVKAPDPAKAKVPDPAKVKAPDPAKAKAPAPDPGPAKAGAPAPDPDPAKAKAPADPGKAPAPAAAKATKTAKQWHAEAATAIRKGDALVRARAADAAKQAYEEASAALEHAIAASEPAARSGLELELAVVEEKLGRLARAADRLRTIIAGTTRPEVIKRATARLDALTTKIGLVMLIVKPDGATIAVDGAVVGTSPLPRALALMPGRYQVRIAAEGREPRKLDIDVEAGSESERTIELAKSPPVAPPPLAGRGPGAAQAAPSRRPLIVGASVTGGLLVVATVTGILATAKHSTFASLDAEPSTRADARDVGKTLALTTDLCLAGAVAAGAFTAYWYLAKYRPGRVERVTARPKVGVTPWVKNTASGFQLVGSF